MEHFTLLKDSVVSNSFDIFTISETWLDSSVNNESIHIPGYTLYRQDRGPHKPGGGLCVYIKKTTKFHHWRMYPQFLIITFSNCG